MGLPERHARERAFAATVAESSARALPPRPRDHDEAQFERAVMSGAGAMGGARVLELGCGDGELTFQLVDAGAEVTALDLSPAMVEVARERLERFRPAAAVRFVAAPAEDTALEAQSFDLVVGKWVLHHTDCARAADEVRRLLAPDGRAIFVETSGLNPLLTLSRRWLPGRFGIERYGTDDERPISRADIRLFEERFERCLVDFPNFVLFQLFDRNVAKWRWAWVSRLCVRLDELALRVRALRPLSYYMRISLGTG
jgi:SAM-dependent methyltransferase